MMALEFLNQLPGWEMVIFFVIFGLFFISAGITTFIFFRNARWNFQYVLFDGTGTSTIISKRGRCRIIAFGDGGEEVFMIKGLNKIKFHDGRRVGHNQIAWTLAPDRLWYPCAFGNFDKKMRELGVVPTHMQVRLAMSSMRKGIDKRLEPSDKWAKIMPLLMAGSLIIALLINAGMTWYQSKKNVEVASINAEGTKTLATSMETVQKTMASVDNILSRNQEETTPSGSGLIISG